MKIHFISIGGSIMHNLAIALFRDGHTVSGSDDEIYNPSLSRLEANQLLPDEMGWHPERLTPDLDCVIIGMHAKPNNPELQKAKSLDLPIFSFPEFVYQQSQTKHRVVIAGSHGKTTVTSMILHVLQYHGLHFDYLVGAQIKGFDLMVRLSDAPVIILEGDEYLSSPIDRVPKIWHYYPQTTVVTGIAWDHKNVFPSFSDYLHAFEEYFDRIEKNGNIIYFSEDQYLPDMIKDKVPDHNLIPYLGFDYIIENDQNYLLHQHQRYPTEIFGAHNMQNAQAAYEVCKILGLTEIDFFEAIQSFGGAAKRLQQLIKRNGFSVYLDFAHAPSKVAATVDAVRSRYSDRTLIVLFELHTFSSLSKDFLPQYKNTLDQADQAVVFVDQHTLEMKGKPMLDARDIMIAFDQDNLKVIFQRTDLDQYLKETPTRQAVILFMSSGTFGGLDYTDYWK